MTEEEEQIVYEEAEELTNSELESLIGQEVVRRETALEVLESMFDALSVSYGLFRDSEMNMIYSIIAKARDRIPEECTSEEFIATLFMDESGEENEDE